jgi:ribosomal protein S17
VKQAIRILMAAGLVAAGLAACKSEPPKTADTSAPPPVSSGAPAEMPAGHPPIAGQPGAPAAGSGAAAPTGKVFTGKVVDTMDASSYTYVQVDNGTEKIWAAAPKFDVKKGDTVTVPEGMPMQNYKSESLNRTFDTVYFVGAIGKGSQMPAMPAAPGAPAGMGMGATAPAGAGGAMPEGLHPKVDASQSAKDANVSLDRKSTRLNSSHRLTSRMPSSA